MAKSSGRPPFRWIHRTPGGRGTGTGTPTPPLTAATRKRPHVPLTPGDRATLTGINDRRRVIPANKQAADAKRAAENEKRYARQRKQAARAKVVPVEVLTADIAHVLALLLSTGIPTTEAIARLVQSQAKAGAEAPTGEVLMELGRNWLNSPLLLAATNELHGGEWHTLEADRRIELSVDKHAAELAYFLLTHDFENAEGIELKKMAEAREFLVARLAGQEGRGDAFEEFMKKALKGELAYPYPTPQSSVVPVPPKPKRES